MRKVLGTLLLLFVAGIGLQAQNFNGGAYAGMSASQVEGDNLSGYNLPGLNLGFFTNTSIGDNSKLQMELAFLQKGSRQQPSDSSRGFKMRLNYIEVPLLYIYRWNDLSFEIGPALDILVTSKMEDEVVGEIEPDTPFNTFNLAGIFGVSYHFSEHFYINFRTNNSITKIRPDNAPDQLTGFLRRVGERNLVLSFAVNYAF